MKFTKKHLQKGITVKKWQSNGYFPVSKYKIEGEDVVLLVRAGNEFSRLDVWYGSLDSQIEYHLFVLNNNNYKLAKNENPKNFD